MDGHSASSTNKDVPCSHDWPIVLTLSPEFWKIRGVAACLMSKRGKKLRSILYSARQTIGPKNELDKRRLSIFRFQSWIKYGKNRVNISHIVLTFFEAFFPSIVVSCNTLCGTHVILIYILTAQLIGGVLCSEELSKKKNFPFEIDIYVCMFQPIASCICFIHIVFVGFIIITPFLSSIPWNIICLHLVSVINLLLHWWLHNDICGLTLAEAIARGTNVNETFMHRIISPVYNLPEDTLSYIVKWVTLLLGIISAWRLWISRDVIRSDCRKIIFAFQQSVGRWR